MSQLKSQREEVQVCMPSASVQQGKVKISLTKAWEGKHR
jgi:hypothetical protein